MPVRGAAKARMSTARLCLWLLRYPLRRWSWLVAAVVTMLLKVGLDLLKPWPMKVLVDQVLSNKPVPASMTSLFGWLPGGLTRDSLLTWSVLATVLIFLLAWALGVVSAYVDIGFGRRMTYDLAGDLFGHLQRLSLRFHRRKSTGDTIRRVTTDCASVSTIVKNALLPAAVAIVNFAAIFAVMWALDPVLMLLSLAAVPPMALTFRRYAGRMMERSYRQQEAEGEVYNVVEQTLSSMPIVQAFGGEERANRRFQEGTGATLDATVATTDVEFRFKILIGLATALGTAAIIWVGGQHVLDGSLTVGSILLFISYLGLLYGPLEAVMYMSSTVQSAAGSARRVLEVLETEQDVESSPGARPLPPVEGHVIIENVTFGYEPGRPVLEDVYLEALPGETVAIVGPTGAGKSTLLSLVARFFDPWEGTVWIDGYDARAVQLRSLRNQVAVVPQDPFLFPTTVAENIAYGRPEASRKKVKAAARAANAHPFIERLPDGYDTKLGERGGTLSGGERQRLAIARALLKDAPILILDEPTSALDSETEGLVMEAMRRLMRGRTTFIIAHRLSTIRNADKIAVLKDCRIVEVGTHEELLARRGVYARHYGYQRGTRLEVAREVAR